MAGPVCFGVYGVKRADKGVVVLGSAVKKDVIPLIVRSKAPELMTFICKSVAERLAPGRGVSVKYNDNLEIYAHCESSNLSGIYVFVFTNPAFPVRSARAAASDTLQWLDGKLSANPKLHESVINSELASRAEKFQDPANIDKIERITKEVEETKAIMVENIEKLLQRGESIDELVKTSEDLSMQSKNFAISAKKLRRKCCIVM